MGLQGIGPEYEGPAEGQFGVGNLQLDATAGNDRPVLAPVELEGFPGLEAQGHENTTTRCLCYGNLSIPIRACGKYALASADVSLSP